MQRRRWWFLGVAGVAAALVLVGCGSDSGGGGAGSAEVKPAAWAEGVCSAVGTWVNDIQAKSETFKTTVEDVSDPAAAKAQLSTFADEVTAQTDAMLSGVKGAGHPDVEDGQAIADQLNNGLATIKPVFAQLKTGVDALPTDSPGAFIAGATALEATFTKGMDAFGDALGKIESADLDEAFEANATCQKIGS